MTFLRYSKVSDDNYIVEETDGWYFWNEVGIEKYGVYKDIQ